MPTHSNQQRLSVSPDELISVTVDASDLTFASAEPLRNIISRYGRPVLARAFADFQQPAFSDLAVQLYQMGFTLVHCPTWPNGDGVPKPIVSDIMAQDLRDQLEELDAVETYLLVATSRDFIAVANALRRHDKRVVVVAEDAKVCRELRLCADEFAILPPTRAERYVETPRPVRAVEPSRPERFAESGRGERSAEVSRVEKSPEPPRVERAPEPVRAEKAESQESPRLPSDSEVLAEVRRIVAAEGICTPRRLARALCPVDRTPTGELRSRIANRIQALIDSGKLQRERLVVGGTSVETILARDERNGKSHAQQPEAASAAASPANRAATLKEPEPAAIFEAVVEEVIAQQEEEARETPAEDAALEQEKSLSNAARDLDALVESVLRAPELVTGMLSKEPEPQPEETPVAVPEAAPAQAEAPKRSRSRRRTSPRAAASPAPETA